MNELFDIAIVGRSCRLPGAPSVSKLWDLLVAGQCAVTEMPKDRWSQERLGHPRAGERGRSYTWAGGVLDDIWGFDPAAFGLSPREAEQMDPQQRLLLELTWEALEDAAIKPSQIAGTEVGVFVGASALDYGNLRILDASGGDAYFATGNALSIISNRVSYVFDLHGPSFTVDTACSSGLVAMNEAVTALRSGRIDTAIVAAVNVQLSPFQFIGFSQATMLSRTGLCQAFSAKADGYVRSEGGIVFVLRTRKAADAAKDRIHNLIAESQINSDGRTSGISLPSKAYQAALLKRIYIDGGLDPNDLAFVEAHGTGTRVGDPIEANAIGEMLGKHRSAVLPIGSIKTNIGHTEAASGLAGLLKASLALENDLVPLSLHAEELNPDIDFTTLNLQVAQKAVPLARNGSLRTAGINSFGFGGTNAHVVIADAPAALANATAHDTPPSCLVISAHSKAALAKLAGVYAQRLDGAKDAEAAAIVAATGHQRERLTHRLVFPFSSREALVETLHTVQEEPAEGETFARGSAVEREAPVAFVYSGNGSQYAGMGVAAYRSNKLFRAHFDKVSSAFEKLAGWSLVDAMHASDLEERLKLTKVAQPLLFAIQSALTHSLAAYGLKPDFVLGHSVGEVAAAEAAGILDLDAAVRVIHFRSLHQELTNGRGTMAVVIGPRQAVDKIIEALPDVEVAATNSPRAFSLSGPAAQIEKLSEIARPLKARVRKLDLAYPFHSRLMAPVEAPLLKDLANLPRQAAATPFISTVTAEEIDGSALDGHYWWRNVREPVAFMEATQAAAKRGARIFLEIGPSATLLGHINDCIEPLNLSVANFCALDKKDRGDDPVLRTFANAITRGARIDEAKAFGRKPDAGIGLPSYPWQRKPYRLHDTSESHGQIRAERWHPLIGARFVGERPEWHCVMDTMLLPYMADHNIDGQVILPGAAFVEMALAVARDWLGTETATVSDLEILSPLPLDAETSREVVCRITPLVSHLEIASRPRLSGAPWQTHVTGKIVREPGATKIDAFRHATGPTIVPASEVYGIAHRTGLNFGPAFQQLASASRLSATTVAVDLVKETEAGTYGLHPARLDSCFHGLILIFADLATRGNQVAYIPVRFGEVKLVKPGVSIAHARIEIKRCDDRIIMADFVLVDDTDDVIATLRDIRYQAIRVSRDAAVSAQTIVQSAILAAEPAAARNDRPLVASAVRDAARVAKCLRENDELGPDFILLEGWATAAAMKAAKAVAEKNKLDLDAAIAGGKLPAPARGWMQEILTALEGSGLAEQQDDTTWTLDLDAALPDPDAILSTFAADHHHSAAELLLAAATSAAIDALAAGDTAAFNRPFAATSLDAFEVGGHQAIGSAALLTSLLKASLRAWPKDRAMRILQIGYTPLSSRIVAMLPETAARLTIFDTERRRLERARLSFESRGDIAFADKIADLPQASFDLVIAAESLHQLNRDPALWPGVRQSMAQSAVFAAVEPTVSLFRDLVFGLEAARAAVAAGGEGVAHMALSDTDWQATLKAAGLTEIGVDRISTPAGGAVLLTGQAAAERRHWSGKGSALIVGDGDARGMETTSSFATLLASSGLHVSIFLDSELNEENAGEASDVVVFFAGALEDNAAAVKSLTEKCMRLKRCAERIGSHKAVVWVVTSGATNAEGRVQGSVATGLWAFTRTLANEMHNLDVRRIDLAAELLPDVVAERLRDLVLSKTDETEIVVAQNGTKVVRFEQLSARDRLRGEPVQAAVLERGEGSGMDRIRWTAVQRRAPEANEVEIAVDATGLNFRDVMWGLGLLPEDILEHGFAGPTLGLECAGRVERVGPGVKHVAIGDVVIAFARSGFATHVTVPASIVAPLPVEVAAETAATIPVAFLTAYYGLIYCARLKRNEWVLIHGGAGGVGLAAMQLAKWRGARIIATAGSPEKRALLKTLGADHVFDSRSGAFVDDVRRVTKDGVAVVLNSLSGEAMERSLGVLRPFGRFVELGKRDYVGNTHIGLRPFRRNLTYFGVDLDQVLIEDPAVSKKLFSAVLSLFAEGTLTPLPHRTFEAHEVVDAFRLMQQSGHIGKLVVKPPKPEDIRVARGRDFAVSAEGTHLITGGLGGFGLATARWLADKGARHIMLVGRSGAASEEAKAALAALAAQGVNAKVEALDVTDKAALQNVFRQFGRAMPPLAGVVHAAMVLDDAAIANLDAEKFERVLRPKIVGAENLDNLTRPLKLDYFIMFSSATTLIGNPGQGAYVAANGFLEGLARRRRRAGLPALAVAWGAIEDVGILAKASAAGTRDTLAARAGVKSMKAREALDLMAQVIKVDSGSEDDAVVAIAPISWGTARQHLPVLNTPTYASLAKGSEAQASERARIDVRDLLAHGETPENVRKIVADLIIEEIARVLRWPKDDVSRTSPLSEIGLDSLMAVELALGLEERFGLKGALSGSATGFTVGELADHVIGIASGSMTESDAITKSMADMHLAGVDVEGLAADLVRRKSENMRDILQ